MKKQLLLSLTTTMALLVLFSTNSYNQELFSTIFNEEANWDNPGGGTWTGYNEKTYEEGEWFFHSTSSVRGTSGESYGGSAYSFRDRDVFTVHNTAPVSGMSGFSMQLRDWMLGSGENRNLNLSTDGGETWETIFVLNKDWFNDYQVYQEYIYMFPDGMMSFDAEEFMLELDGGGNTNNGRINIGQFVALGESTMVVTPSFNPNGGTFFNPVDVEITSATPGAVIFYSTESEEGPWIEYSTAVTVTETTTIWAYAAADGMDDSNVAHATFNFPELTEVETLAALRDMPVDGTYYIYTGDAVLVAMDGFRNRKFIQDETAAILIDDQPGTISTEYELYDVISNVAGQLNVFNNMLRFQPLANTEPATENTPVEAQVFTLDEVTSDDQAKLIEFKNVVFVDIDEGQVFTNGTNYTLSDGVNEFTLRTDFWNVDYTGEIIPDYALDITGVIIQFQDILQIVPRFAADMVEHIEETPLDVITMWTFNGTSEPTIGEGFASLIGGTIEVDLDNRWRMVGFPDQFESSGTAGAEFMVSTEGYEKIMLTYGHRSSGTQSRWAEVHYTIDGGETWEVLGNNNGGLSPHDIIYDFSFDLEEIPGATDNPEFGFRIVSTFSPVPFNPGNPDEDYEANTAYHRARISGGSPYEGGEDGGNWRLHDVTVWGEPFEPVEPELDLIHFIVFDGNVPNNTPLEELEFTYSANTPAHIFYHSALEGYPFDPEHPLWRKASMERRNAPTPINYKPEGNSNIQYPDAGVRGLQVKQPFTGDGGENTMVFHLPTTGFMDVVFAFAAMDEGAADYMIIDYSVAAGEPQWTNEGMEQTEFPLLTDEYQLYEISFANIENVDHNPNFMIRMRFAGEDMEEDDGDRVTFNNFSLEGTEMEFEFYTVTFVVNDQYGNPVDDAVITLGDLVNEPGNYVFEEVTEGTYIYNVSAFCFLDQEAELVVANDSEIVIVLENVPGDANGDGVVNILDIISTSNYWSNQQEPELWCFINADVNGDGVINILDIIGISNIWAQK